MNIDLTKNFITTITFDFHDKNMKFVVDSYEPIIIPSDTNSIELKDVVKIDLLSGINSVNVKYIDGKYHFVTFIPIDEIKSVWCKDGVRIRMKNSEFINPTTIADLNEWIKRNIHNIWSSSHTVENHVFDGVPFKVYYDTNSRKIFDKSIIEPEKDYIDFNDYDLTNYDTVLIYNPHRLPVRNIPMNEFGEVPHRRNFKIRVIGENENVIELEFPGLYHAINADIIKLVRRV